MKMSEKFVLITGASGGIGREISRRLAAEGWNLYLHYHQNEKGIMALAHELERFPGKIKLIQADLSRQDGHLAILEQISELDAIILNSGDSFFGLVTDMTDEEARRMITLHVTAPFLLTKGLVSKLINKRAGNIIAVTSIWGEIGASCEVLYSMVKGGQNTFVRALSKELAPSGIRVNAVSPGAIATPMLKSFDEQELEGLAEEIPMGRLGRPEEIAGVISFLLSEDAAYMTGQILSVNGGWSTT